MGSPFPVILLVRDSKIPPTYYNTSRKADVKDRHEAFNLLSMFVKMERVSIMQNRKQSIGSKLVEW